MNSLFKRFRKFIETDVKDSRETRDLAVMIRITSIYAVFYYLFCSFIFAFLGHFILAFTMVWCIALCCGAFVCTYEDHTTAALIIVNISILTSVIMCTLRFGNYCAFYLPAFGNILTVFYKQSEHSRHKSVYTLLLTAGLMLLSLFGGLWPGRLHLGPRVSDILLTGNIFFFGIYLLGTAYAFGSKFSRSEEKLRKINENLERLANYDSLTSLPNRRYITQILTDMVHDNKVSGKIFTIAIGDIDHFKKVNDSYGHDAGDHLLSTIAGELRAFMRYKGYVARWGGEEFLFIFENTGLDAAAGHLDALRENIEGIVLDHKDMHLGVTMTFGAEEFNPHLGLDAAINNADKKLYEGKESGRNRVVSR